VSKTATQNELTNAQLDRKLNEQILAGDFLAAFDAFYADDVVMQENGEPPTRGKAENRAREEQFLSTIEQFHGAKLVRSATNGDISFSEWESDVTFKGGHHFVVSQVAVREWKEGKVARERFYYNKG
jgi:ketosteroid isomerase-like protein